MSSVANRFRIGEYKLYEPSVGFDRYSSHKALIEDYLRDLSFSDDPRLATLVGAMCDSLSRGGGRIRPVLCLEVAGAFELDPAEALPSAAAVELLHTGSLVHDGLPAIGDGREGSEPACNEDAGEATVILVGDAFFSEALNLVTNHQEANAEQLLEVIRELATSTGAGGMIGGQAITVKLAGQIVDSGTLNTAHSYRTGALLASTARIGAALGGGTSEEKEALSEYARRLGLCAQVTADVLNAHSESEMPVNGNKTEHEKTSFVQVYGLLGARRLADEAAREALRALDRLDRDTRGLAEMVHFAYSGTDKPII